MRVLTEITRHRLNLPNVVTAFYAMAEPRLPTVLRDVASTGKFDRVLVYPHLLFHGRLYQAIVKQTNEAAAEFPKIDFSCTGYLGANALVADAIADRVLRPNASFQSASLS
jgi:sirohydrochlorin cobaltochelatase